MPRNSKTRPDVDFPENDTVKARSRLLYLSRTNVTPLILLSSGNGLLATAQRVNQLERVNQLLSDVTCKCRDAIAP